MARCFACPKELGNGGIISEDGRLLCPSCESQEQLSGSTFPKHGTPWHKNSKILGYVAIALFCFCVVICLSFLAFPRVVKEVIVEKEVEIVEKEVVKEVVKWKEQPNKTIIKEKVDKNKINVKL